MRTELTITELDAETVELLPARETLHFHFGHNLASVSANNQSFAINAGSVLSSAESTAWQGISVNQS